MFRKKKFEQELDAELRSYVELQAAEKVRRGLSPENARREAWRELGGLDQVKESVRDVGPGVFADTLLRTFVTLSARWDATGRLRLLRFSRWHLGIGANTAIFTVVNGVVLKPLPYPDPNQLLTLWERSQTDGLNSTVAPANFYDWREQSRSFTKMVAIDAYPTLY